MLGVDDARVEGEHAQQGERPEDDEPLPVVVAVDEAEDLLPLLLQDPVVELPMRGAELDGDDLLLLLGQIGGDEILRPPHEERPDPSLKPLHPARILPGLDRSDVLLLEPVRGREQTRREIANSDHTSRSEFSNGVPVSASRNGASIDFAA